MIPEKGRLKVALVEKIINDANVDYRYERGEFLRLTEFLRIGNFQAEFPRSDKCGTACATSDSPRWPT